MVQIGREVDFSDVYVVNLQPPTGIVAALLKVGKPWPRHKVHNFSLHNQPSQTTRWVPGLLGKKLHMLSCNLSWAVRRHDRQIVLTCNFFTAANLTWHHNIQTYIDHLLGHRHLWGLEKAILQDSSHHSTSSMSTHVFTFDQVSSCFFTCPRFLFPFRCCVFPAWFHECYGLNFHESWRWEMLDGISSGSLRCVAGTVDHGKKYAAFRTWCRPTPTKTSTILYTHKIMENGGRKSRT